MRASTVAALLVGLLTPFTLAGPPSRQSSGNQTHTENHVQHELNMQRRYLSNHLRRGCTDMFILCEEKYTGRSQFLRRNILLKIYKGSLENPEDFQEQDLLQVSVVGNIDKNETSAALTTSTVRIPTPGSIQLIENYAELYPSNRWMDTETYLQSAQTISEACSAALLDHDYTYFMDEDDKTWLDNTNYQCRVEEQIAQETPSAETDEIFSRVSISEDEFELVMGLFEILTGPKLQQELPDFSFFKPFFLAPLRPDTFASHVVPAWIRPPSVLSSIALTIHPHWHQRRSLRGGRKIFPSLNSEENDYINAAYAKLGSCRQILLPSIPGDHRGSNLNALNTYKDGRERNQRVRHRIMRPKYRSAQEFQKQRCKTEHQTLNPRSSTRSLARGR
ncbi:hypothetical protein B0H14DRAFT_3148282 [Mycena olivaceomarginata]|nr:hypothetical protein B0H14DRAFT_3148282 [Mycena olivaceomarginata]